MKQKRADLNLHRIMCVVGGFMGAYAILIRCDNLGSAQTSNLIYLVLNLLGRDLPAFLIRLGGVFVYFLAIEITVLLEKKTQIDLKKYALFAEGGCLLILGFLSKDADPVLCLYPIFFMMSTQWCVFHGTGGYNSSTIFSTNNFKQFSLALGSYVLEKDSASREKMILFANSLIFFHIGVAVSFYASRLFQFPLGVFSVTLGVVSLTELSKARADNDLVRRNEIINKAFLSLFIIIIPATIGLIGLSTELIKFVFQDLSSFFIHKTSAFSDESVLKTSIALKMLALSGFFSSITIIVLKSIFINNDLSSYEDAYIRNIITIGVALVFWPFSYAAYFCLYRAFHKLPKYPV